LKPNQRPNIIIGYFKLKVASGIFSKMAETENQNIEGLIKSRYYRRRLFTSSKDLERVDPPLPHCHTVRRAFGRLRLDAVLYVDRAPTAYFKRVKRFDAKNIRQWHTYLWNQHVVPLLVIISDTEVKVYSGQALPTDKDDNVDDYGRLVQVFGKVADVLELDEVLEYIETGEIFRKPDSFNRKNAVDRCLLENLTDTASKLINCPNHAFTPEFAHLFLMRMLFVCYLIERKMINGENFADDAVLSHIGGKYEHLVDMLNDLSLSQAMVALFQLFEHLKAHFNGSLLDTDLNKEKQRVTDQHIQIIRSFLNGDDLRKGQYALSFWAYDFSVIPIETISAIYQGFISEQGELQQTSGAYYTPPHLAELTVDILLENYKKPLYESKVLDPACGSGVFLVSMFNRMAGQWMARRGNHHRKTRARELLNLLENQLFGIDVNETACHITCFSLYVAVLDQLEPWDVEKLKEQGLRFPPLLSAKNKQEPNGKPRTIVHGNFFHPQLKLDSTDFDFVIGNTPWISRDKCNDKFFLDWQRHDKDIRGPQKQIAHGFMWKASERMNDSGKACLLLPAAVLLSKTDKFQTEWLRQVTVEKVINFSDLRFVLFADAIHPGIAVRFNKTKADIVKNKIRYESPKVDIRSQLSGGVYIYDEDTKTIRLSELLAKAQNNEAPEVWKTRLWGTWRDLKLLQRLSDMPRLIDITGTPKKPKRFIKGQGFQAFNPKPTSDIAKIKRKKEPEPPWWSPETLFLPTKKIMDLIVTKNDCQAVDDKFSLLLFPRDRKLFKGPKVLISQGSRDMKVVFCDFEVIFQSSLQTITGNENEKDANLLRFLSVALKSDVIQYYLFHTSANWGTERDKVLFYELLRAPFMPPQATTDPKKSSAIVSEVGQQIKALSRDIQKGKYYGGGRHDVVEELRNELESFICQYYDIDEYEQILVEDTVNYIIPSITPGPNPRKEVKTLMHVNAKQRQTYTETLCKMLNIHARTGRKVEGYVVKSDSQAVVLVSRVKGTPSPYHEKTAPGEMRRVLNRIDTLVEARRGGFVYYRNLKIFDQDHIYIVKPMTFRSWMRTTALNDADEIASAVLKAGEGRRWE